MIHSKDTRILISKNLMGHEVTEETREKISEGHKGKPKEWLKGKSRSQKIKNKIRETKQNQDCSHSEETKRKISEAKKGKAPWNKGMKLK